MARGIPSSRRQISPTVAASRRLRAIHEEPYCIGVLQRMQVPWVGADAHRAHREQPFSLDAQAFATRGDQPDPVIRGQELIGEFRDRA
jgi:hypothetical protein